MQLLAKCFLLLEPIAPHGMEVGNMAFCTYLNISFNSWEKTFLENDPQDEDRELHTKSIYLLGIT